MDQGYEWRKDPSCQGLAYQKENPFFKQGRGEVYKVARVFCSGCPVVVDCLLDSIEEPIGFFGCMSPAERTGLRRDLKLGLRFKLAVEKVWQYHRNQGEDRAPEGVIWMEWNT